MHKAAIISCRILTYYGHSIIHFCKTNKLNFFLLFFTSTKHRYIIYIVNKFQLFKQSLISRNVVTFYIFPMQIFCYVKVSFVEPAIKFHTLISSQLYVAR